MLDASFEIHLAVGLVPGFVVERLGVELSMKLHRRQATFGCPGLQDGQERRADSLAPLVGGDRQPTNGAVGEQPTGPHDEAVHQGYDMVTEDVQIIALNIGGNALPKDEHLVPQRKDLGHLLRRG